MDRDSILDRVWVHLNTLSVNPDTVLYFYSALELRFFIESLFFELLMHYRRRQPSPNDLKMYRPQDYCAMIARIEPSFATEGAEVLGIPKLDQNALARMRELYGKLGSYLHLPKLPYLSQEQEKWKMEMEKLVIDAFEYLNSFTRDPWRNSSDL